MKNTSHKHKVLLGLLFVLAAIVVAIDQVTKALAIVLLEGEPSVDVIGDLAGFTFLRNPGAAFGMGAQTTWLFVIVAAAVFVGILVFARRLESKSWAIALGLLLGGLSGNLVDRIFREPSVFHGAVVDFIDLHFFVCNVADIAISAAAVLIIITSIRGIGIDGTVDDGHREPAAAGPEDTESGTPAPH